MVPLITQGALEMATRKKKDEAAPAAPAAQDINTTLTAEKVQAAFKVWQQTQPNLNANVTLAAGERWRLDSAYVATEVLRIFAAISPDRDAILKRYDEHTERARLAAHFDQITPLATSLLFVELQSTSQVRVVAKLSSEQLQALIAEGRTLRELAERHAPLLVSMGLTSQPVIDDISAGRGLMDQSSDLVQYGALFNTHWAKLEPVQPVVFSEEADRLTAARVARMGEVGTTLATLVGRGVDPSAVKGVKWRDQLRANQYLLRKAVSRAAAYHYECAEQLDRAASIVSIHAMRKPR
jgi:hypothetical protein